LPNGCNGIRRFGSSRETVERLLGRHTAKLREAAQLVDGSQQSQTPSVPDEAAFPLMAWQKLSKERRAARLQRYEEVVRLRAQGLSSRRFGGQRIWTIGR
jgi:hypothetical protein